jgi:hypothetical protein
MSLVNCHCRAILFEGFPSDRFANANGRIELVTVTPNRFNKLRPSSIHLNHFLANLSDMYANKLVFSCVVAVPPPDFFD